MGQCPALLNPGIFGEPWHWRLTTERLGRQRLPVRLTGPLGLPTPLRLELLAPDPHPSARDGLRPTRTQLSWRYGTWPRAFPTTWRRSGPSPGTQGFRCAQRPLSVGQRRWTGGVLLHSTSALRYPVLKDRRNYRGSPRVETSRLLSEMMTANLPHELEQLPDALIIPLGRSVEGALAYLGLDRSRRMLRGFPHPSRANGHRVAQFKREYQQLCRTVRTL